MGDSTATTATAEARKVRRNTRNQAKEKRAQRAAQGRRYATIRKFLLEGWSPQTIRNKVMEIYEVRPDVVRRDVDLVLAEVRGEIRLDADRHPHDRDVFASQLDDAIADSRISNGGRGLAPLMRLKMDLHGWDEPQQIQVQLPPGVVEAVTQGLSMTPAQRRTRIAELEAKERDDE